MGKGFSLTGKNFKINYRVLGICKEMSEKDTKHCNICLESDCKYNKADFSESEGNTKHDKSTLATLIVPDDFEETHSLKR